MATDYRPIFWEGHRAEADAECPYLISSNYADAWMLGRFAKLNGIDIEKRADLVKCRGYKWNLKGVIYTVSGRVVREFC